MTTGTPSTATDALPPLEDTQALRDASALWWRRGLWDHARRTTLSGTYARPPGGIVLRDYDPFETKD